MTHEGEGKIYCKKVVIKINNKALPREMYTSVLRECCHVSPKCTNIHTYICMPTMSIYYMQSWKFYRSTHDTIVPKLSICDRNKNKKKKTIIQMK